MKYDWLEHALDLSVAKADFFSGARKIIRGRMIEFSEIKNDLVMHDCGFTKSKMTMLVKHYKHEESIEAAHRLWERLCDRDKYGSVGFHTYNHLIKGATADSHGQEAEIKGKTKRGSVMGPCLQSVILTRSPSRRTAIDVFWRTTEFYKKYPADLVFLRDSLLDRFELGRIDNLRCHFANITLHSMYWVTLVPLMDDPIAELEKIRIADPRFFGYVVVWSARYLCGGEYERGLLKYAQGLRVQKDAQERIDPKVKKALVKYLIKQGHSRFKTAYTAPEEDDDTAD